MSMEISTDVTGDVTEHHFECQAPDCLRAFSILLKEDDALEVAVKDEIECVLLGCTGRARYVGSNPCEVSKDPATLLEH